VQPDKTGQPPAATVLLPQVFHNVGTLAITELSSPQWPVGDPL
jgi:hypothetical protein